jgi:hypothetical protein
MGELTDTYLVESKPMEISTLFWHGGLIKYLFLKAQITDFKSYFWTGRVAQAVEHLFSKHEAEFKAQYHQKKKRIFFSLW